VFFIHTRRIPLRPKTRYQQRQENGSGKGGENRPSAMVTGWSLEV
jgi:hypothetical protein